MSDFTPLLIVGCFDISTRRERDEGETSTSTLQSRRCETALQSGQHVSRMLGIEAYLILSQIFTRISVYRLSIKIEGNVIFGAANPNVVRWNFCKRGRNIPWGKSTTVVTGFAFVLEPFLLCNESFSSCRTRLGLSEFLNCWSNDIFVLGRQWQVEKCERAIWSVFWPVVLERKRRSSKFPCFSSHMNELLWWWFQEKHVVVGGWEVGVRISSELSWV